MEFAQERALLGRFGADAGCGRAVECVEFCEVSGRCDVEQTACPVEAVRRFGLHERVAFVEVELRITGDFFVVPEKCLARGVEADGAECGWNDAADGGFVRTERGPAAVGMNKADFLALHAAAAGDKAAAVNADVAVKLLFDVGQRHEARGDVAQIEIADIGAVVADFVTDFVDVERAEAAFVGQCGDFGRKRDKKCAIGKRAEDVADGRIAVNAGAGKDLFFGLFGIEREVDLRNIDEVNDVGLGRKNETAAEVDERDLQAGERLGEAVSRKLAWIGRKRIEYARFGGLRMNEMQLAAGAERDKTVEFDWRILVAQIVDGGMLRRKTEACEQAAATAAAWNGQNMRSVSNCRFLVISGRDIKRDGSRIFVVLVKQRLGERLPCIELRHRTDAHKAFDLCARFGRNAG